jgi:NCK-associated protein 1
LDAVGPTVLLGSDFQRLCSEGYLSPFHPRYPEKLTNSAHPARAQDLANIDTYREWVLLGYLVCPVELLRVRAVDIAMVILKESLLLPLFRDEYIFLHEEYQQHVLPRIVESKKLAKAGRSKARDADAEYNLAKLVEKQMWYVVRAHSHI